MTVTEAGSAQADSGVRGEAQRRRTFAVISHPDAGKSTLTEALALHAKAINQAGAVHGEAAGAGSPPTGWPWKRTVASRSRRPP